MPGVSLNIYLAEIAEDRGLRSNARHVTLKDGIAFSTGAPERMRLHYVITAWSHAKNTPLVHATETEHALLGAVLAMLYRTAPISAERLLSHADTLALPEELRGDLPTRLAPPDGFPQLAEFWGTMGRPQAWKPAINLFVTAPIVYQPDHIGGIVDAILADVGVAAEVDANAPPAASERVLVVGGLVLDARPPHALAPVPVAGPRRPVRARRRAPRPHHHGRVGQFTFDGLTPGTYQLAYRAAGIGGQAPVPVTVPLATGPVRLAFV